MKPDLVSENDFFSYIPNKIATPTGSRSLYEKALSSVIEAEKWFFNTVASLEFLTGSSIRDLAVPAIVCHALAKATPSLDITYHPNGLATVNTDSLQPASAARAARLSDSLMERRDDHVSVFIEAVRTDPQWRRSAQAMPFVRSMFFSPADLWKHLEAEKVSLDSYFAFTSQAALLEFSLAASHFSQQLMTRFREEDFVPGSPAYSVRQRLKEYVAAQICRRPAPPFSLMDLVDIIRKNPDIFPEWHSSNVSKLFLNPVVFKNRRNSGGYFF